jgi:hypothetical protein
LPDPAVIFLSGGLHPPLKKITAVPKVETTPDYKVTGFSWISLFYLAVRWAFQ